ncbi:KilA-N domain-containing protein [Moorena sp. SIO3A2]|uniref:KilA-N domain-containing protein n=1 Tax=Moorena sp. SIO3A2 TaxID=2607841 RepID=UPI0013BA4BFC|nr:KilA-N domain-containing protein [Moorena sp. SIO3A2]NER92254.1 KilA-N domain-containing protein [Moorena sp. SIO3A2]
MLMHNFGNDKLFPQTTEETTIAGITIPIGWVNLTLMCVNQGKKPNAFTRQKTTIAYIKALKEQLEKERRAKRAAQDIDKTGEENPRTSEETTEVLISVTEKNNVPNAVRGVWCHPELAIKCAAWISPEFEVWAMRTLRQVIEGGFTPNSPEAVRAQAIIQRAWEVQLLHSRRQRRSFTDCLKEAIIREHGEEFYRSPASAAIFAKYTAIAQNRLTGFPNFNGNRENCTEEQLDMLARFEQTFATLFETFYPDEYSFDELFEKVLRKMS